MVQDRLAIELDRVAQRYQRLWGWQSYAVAWLLGAVIALAMRGAGFSLIRSSSPYANMLILGTGVLLVYSIFHWRFLIADRYWVARKVEQKFPNLESCLLTAVEQTPDLPDGRFGFLQESVIHQALRHAAANDWLKVVSKRRMLLAMTTSMVSFGLFIWSVGRPAPANAISAVAGKHSPNKTPTGTGEFSVTVEPGDTEVERGSSLLVLARVQGPLPADATLVSVPASGDPVRLEMSPSLDDPIFGGRVSAVNEPFEYRVELGEHVSPAYHVTVFEYPRLERADAKLKYPGYTGLEERLVQDIRSISVVEGTEVTLLCKLNKGVKTARFVESSAGEPDESGDKKASEVVAGSLPLTEREGRVYDVKFTADKTRRLKLELVDERGRRNTEKVLIVVQVVPNQPPTLKLVAPGRDLEVSPLEELDLKATVWDDYGVKRMGVTFGLAGQPATDLVLGENAVARQRHELANLIRFEDLKAEPDQLLAYHFWAEDAGPDGALRRTSSDMFFAEVRHFDEIFRQGQQPPGGQQQQRQQQGGSQNAQAAQQLADLQKEIINATWKVVRRETSSKLSELFPADVNQILQSQSAATEQAEALAPKITDADAQTHLLAVMEAMELAVKHLKVARDQPAAAALQPALAAEQSAYQALLKLRAREHEVVRQQQQQSSSSASQSARSQQQRQQMQQLDLTNEENRYETQRLAQAAPEKPEDRETKQVLNRLKELARRQHDLNERLKDLQSALQEAQNEQKKEEIRQQLKRLQDEQRDVLRDTDELQTRMESPENQERMADERQQLEQARDQVRRASESLEQDQVTQAAASGTRAEKEFDELRNEFRRRASNRFNEEMREMRDAARALEQQENKLAEQLAQTGQPNSTKKSLRDDSPLEQISKELTEQKERLSTLTERVKQTVTEAEQTEPLLSERLHDAARNLQDQKVEPALDAATRSVRQGLLEDARVVERIAGRGITQLREGIEKAAESVLGDESEALRRAKEQLKNLAQELNQEIARNAPEEEPKPAAGRDREREPSTPAARDERDGGEAPPAQSDRKNKPGENQDGTRERPNGEQPGQGSARESQPGQKQMSEPRPGSAQSQSDARSAPGDKPNGRPTESQPESQGQPGQRSPAARQTSEREPGGGNQPVEGDKTGAAPNAERPQSASRTAATQQRTQRGPGTGADQNQPQNGERPQSESSGQQNQPGQNPQGDPRPGQRPGQRGRAGAGNPTGLGGGAVDGTNERLSAPIAGDDFLNWSDRLRDVEEMVDDPELRAEAARIREQARSIRAEMKRHSATPNWKLVRVNVAEPLIELSNRVADELLRRNSKQAIVPLDRDPVPPKYSEKTRRYYEQLGSGK